MIIPKSIVRTVLGLSCAGAALPAMAQDGGEIEGLETAGVSAKYAVIGGLGHRFESDIDDGGKSSLTSLRFSGGAMMNVSELMTFNFLGSYTFNAYDFEDVADPWDSIHTLRMTPLIQYHLNEQWGIYGGPTFSFSGEDGADIGDSFTMGGLAGFTYAVNPGLTLGLGLGVFGQIEDDTRVIPIPTVKWKFAEDWNLHLGYTEVAGNGGYGAEVGYDLTDTWKIGAGAQLQRRRFRLEDDNVGEDRSMSVFGKAAWQPSERWALEFLAGVNAGGEYTFEDEDGHKIADTDYDPSLVLGVRGILTF